MDIDLRNIRDVFFQMELKESLFAMRLDDGTCVWDVIRLNVFYALHTSFGGPYAMPEPVSRSRSIAVKMKEMAGAVLNRLSRRYLAARRPQYIFITGQRLKHHDELFDNISDHLIVRFGGRAVAIETMNRRAISYHKMLVGAPTRIPPTFLRRRSPTPDLIDASNKVTQIVARYFGRQLDLSTLIPEPVEVFRQYREYYRRLFSSHRPRAIVLINNGSYKGLFAAAREFGIPTVELQHGASCANNIFWSYPVSIASTAAGLYLPTGYLTFSDYWRSNTHYPVRVSRAIGNDFFHQEPAAGSDDLIVIISAYMYHDALLPLTLGLADAFPAKTIFYKLHPHQFASRSAIVEQLSERPNIDVVSEEIDIPQLFRRCGFVIGVHSTLLHSALEAGKKVCVYKRDNYFWHEDIFAYVEQFDDLRELSALVSEPQRYFGKLADRPSFFDPFNPTRFDNALVEIEALVVAT